MAYPMTTETLIQKVRDELGTLDAKSEEAVATAAKILHNAETIQTPQPSEEKFLSKNITLEEYVALPRPERRRYQDEAEKLNQRWVEKQFKKNNARWIMVVDGQVVGHGSTLQDFPDHDEILAVCESTGKYPFAFLSPSVFAIEEVPTKWHATQEHGDAYPALTITLYGNRNRFETEADLDTGAVDCYASLELLTASGVVKVQNEDFSWTSEHLTEPFVYFSLPLLLELKNEAGVSRQRRTAVICVEDWRNSPFVAINPDRTFLLGRSVLLSLQPRLTLDFSAKCTEVQFSEIES